MDMKPENIEYDVRKIGEEVKNFVTEQLAYYGVTRSGYLFNIIKTRTIQPHIEDENDYHTYMWVHCIDGYYLLRERFIEGHGVGWYLEVEIIPKGKTPEFFMKMAGLFYDNPEILNEICGPPHDVDETTLTQVEI
jgi:hypothetical protein